MIIAVNELCKVRNRAVSRVGKGYCLAVFNGMKNKTTASVSVFFDCMATDDCTSHNVPLSALWKLKTNQRKILERKTKLRREKENKPPPVVQPPPPLITRVEMMNDFSTMGVNVVAKLMLGNSPVAFLIANGSVVDFDGDAIVNAANEGCLGGGGIDGAINGLGGPLLYEARKRLPLVSDNNPHVRCNTGDAKITIAGNLNCDNVIHAVGPRFGLGDVDHSQDLKVLEDTYKSSLERAREAGLETVGFCLISAGIFRGSCPLSRIVQTSIESIAKHVYDGLKTVVLCGFTANEQQHFLSALQRMQT